MMSTVEPVLRDVIDGATAVELRGVLLALEGRVADVGKREFYYTARNTESVHGAQREESI